MDKEEILKKSRAEYKNKDEWEASVLASAGKLAAQVGMAVCCAIAVLEVIFTDQVSYSSWMIYFGILGTLFLYKAVKLKERHEQLLAALFSTIFVMFTVLFVIRLLG